MAPTRQDVINDALERLSGLGFTMENSFSEHGPMVAETITTLGRNEDVAGWVERYKQAHRGLTAAPAQQPAPMRKIPRSLTDAFCRGSLRRWEAALTYPRKH